MAKKPQPQQVEQQAQGDALDPQHLVNVLVQQRNSALDQVAALGARLETALAENKKLKVALEDAEAAN